ncbi:MAG: hypothetical protein JJU28_19515 [Cyclobacteriaceae bacterium]|nr:hypothetical protein [Cyclobacteriaceae bacterium]
MQTILGSGGAIGVELAKEMLCQYDRDYVFSSEKFEKRFGIKPTPYDDGIREVVKSLE